MSVRRTLAVGVAAILVLAVAACGGASARALEERDSGSKVEMRLGDGLEVRLPSNVTTGFTWELVDDGGLTQAREPEYEDPQDPGAVGAGGTQVFAFTARRTGSGNLTFEYKRPWEKDVPAEKTWRATIEVR